jgi:hypothetical protein
MEVFATGQDRDNWTNVSPIVVGGLERLSPQEQCGLTILDWLLSPQQLAPALRALAAGYEDLAKRLKPSGPISDNARMLFLWIVPAMVEYLTGRPHDAETATLYEFVFGSPILPASFTRLRSRTKAP